MVIAVAAVRVMEMAADEVVGVLPMRHGGMTASGAVRVASGVRGAFVVGRAGGGVRPVHREAMLVGVPTVDVVQMPFVQVVRVAVMGDGDMAAARPVRVRLGVLPVRDAAGGRKRGDSEEGEG